MASFDKAAQNWPAQDVSDLVRYPVQEDGMGPGFDLKLRQIYLAVLRNAAWLALIIALFVGLGIALTLLITPRYTSTALVMVEQGSTELIKGGDVDPQGETWDAERFLQTQLDIIRSKTLAGRVVDQAKLANDPRFYEAFGTVMPDAETAGGRQNLAAVRKRAATDILAEALSTNLPMNSGVIQLSFTTEDPVVSARLANSYAEAFVENNLSRKFDSSLYARRFLQDQLDQARARLETSERDLNRYSRAAGLIRLSGQDDQKGEDSALSVTNDALVQLNTSANTATSERVAAEDGWKTIAGQPLLSIPQVIGNSAVQALLTQKAQLEGQLADERARHLDDYPAVKALKAQIASLNGRIETIGQSVKKSVYLEYQAALAKEQSLKGQVSGLRTDALTEQDRGVQYTLLRRVADTNRALYDALLERYNQINASAGSASNNVSLVDRAEVATKPSSPNFLFNTALALVLGLIAGAIFVYLREIFDDRIREPGDVENKLGLPLLGLIPVADESDIGVDLSAPKSIVYEAYHSLVTNLQYAAADGLPRVLAVTSSGQGEGKTTTSWAVASDLARLGKNVLLIDADLRRPSLHRRLPTRDQRGLTDVLIGQTTLTESMVPSGSPNLTYLTALPIPPDPTVLLGSGNFGRIIEEAKSRFDIVIVDCPPLLGLSDTPSIAKHVDGFLFMVDASGFHRGAVKSALRRLALIGAKVFGVVLIKFDPKGSGSDYSYYAYNYYSYGASDPRPS